MYSKQGLLSLKNFNLKTYSIRIPPLRSNESDICCSVGDSNHGHSDSILTQFLPLSNCFHSTPPIMSSWHQKLLKNQGGFSLCDGLSEKQQKKSFCDFRFCSIVKFPAKRHLIVKFLIFLMIFKSKLILFKNKFFILLRQHVEWFYLYKKSHLYWAHFDSYKALSLNYRIQ